MKQTVNVNIGSMPFTLDEDAYRMLRDYFDDIRDRLPDDDTETEADLETRMGEILREKVASPMYVVSIDTVRAAIDRLGTPDCFGARHGDAAADEREPEPQPTYRKLYRSRENRSIAGVCGGLAEYLGSDPSVLRLVTLLLILFGGISIWIYVILWIVIPEEPVRKFDVRNRKSKNA